MTGLKIRNKNNVFFLEYLVKFFNYFLNYKIYKAVTQIPVEKKTQNIGFLAQFL